VFQDSITSVTIENRDTVGNADIWIIVESSQITNAQFRLYREGFMGSNKHLVPCDIEWFSTIDPQGDYWVEVSTDNGQNWHESNHLIFPD